MKQTDKKIYLNKIQQRVMYIGAKTTVVVAGRRTGKTYGIGAPFALRNMQRMPGSTGGIVVPTFRHGLTNTLPGLFSFWKNVGLVEGIHYVVGKRPPKTFAKAKIEPREYEHVISFYNGSRAVLISQDITGSSNSLTLDWLLVDEAKFINFAKEIYSFICFYFVFFRITLDTACITSHFSAYFFTMKPLISMHTT